MASAPARWPVGKMVFVKNRADKSRWPCGEGIFFQQSQNFRAPFQQPNQQRNEPCIIPIVAERREPHLPIQPWLMRCDPPRWLAEIAGFISELVRMPLFAVIAPFNQNFQTLRCHDRKKPVAV